MVARHGTMSISKILPHTQSYIVSKLAIIFSSLYTSFRRLDICADTSYQGIAHMNGVGNLGGWRWIFILEGLLTIVVSFAAYFFIHNYPATATFLSEEERARVYTRLKASNDATRDEAFSWKNVTMALKDPKVLLYGLGFHTMSLPLYTLSLFLPTIIKALGYTSAQAQLLTVPPYSVATVLTLIVAVASEKTKIRAPFIMGTSSLAIIGYIILLTSTKPGVSYFGDDSCSSGHLSICRHCTFVAGEQRKWTNEACNGQCTTNLDWKPRGCFGHSALPKHGWTKIFPGSRFRIGIPLHECRCCWNALGCVESGERQAGSGRKRR